jgi:putative transposase
MPNYRRVYLPCGIYFLPWLHIASRPLFKDPANVELLRAATAQIKAKKTFEILAAVVLPDHIHFVWQLPPSVIDL